MGHPIREFHNDRFYFLTNRTARQEFLLTPGQGLEEMIAARLLVAALNYGIDIYGFIALSNHWHLCCRAPKGNLHAFARDFQSIVARDVNKKRGRTGPFWGRRYSAEEIRDQKALESKLVYILANPAASDLTETVLEWPGLSSAPELLQNSTRTFRIFDKAAWIAAGTPDDKKPYFKDVAFQHAVLPTMADLSPETRAKKLAELLAVVEKKHAERRAAEDKGVLGEDRIVSTPWWDSPISSDKSPRPLCHASEEADYFVARNERWRFLSLYREASKRYRTGELDVKFPEGSFKPWLARPEDVANRARPPSVAPG